MNNNKINKICPKAFINLEKLEVIDFSWNNINEIDKKVFNGLNNLIYINLRFNKIKRIHKNTFKGLNNLKSIILKGNHEINEIGIICENDNVIVDDEAFELNKKS